MSDGMQVFLCIVLLIIILSCTPGPGGDKNE